MKILLKIKNELFSASFFFKTEFFLSDYQRKRLVLSYKAGSASAWLTQGSCHPLFKNISQRDIFLHFSCCQKKNRGNDKNFKQKTEKNFEIFGILKEKYGNLVRFILQYIQGIT